jgi:hypothetical protein
MRHIMASGRTTATVPARSGDVVELADESSDGLAAVCAGATESTWMDISSSTRSQIAIHGRSRKQGSAMARARAEAWKATCRKGYCENSIDAAAAAASSSLVVRSKPVRVRVEWMDPIEKPAVGGKTNRCGALHRSSEYADGKPRPLFRGVLHGLMALALAAGAIESSFLGLPELAMGFAGKMVTYGASANFHLYPFSSVKGVTRAFIADVAFILFAPAGGLAPFLLGAETSVVAREVALASLAILLNFACVAWQCAGQSGLRTRADRSDTPRTVVLVAYTAWAFIFVGTRTAFSGVWCALLGLSILAIAVSLPVTQAHAEEPHVERVPWHARGIWGLHEDFHLVLAISDCFWLALAVGFTAAHWE